MRDVSLEPAHGFNDYLLRQYFRDCLTLASADEHEGVIVQTFWKTRETALAPHIDDCGWTFGILTSGASAQAAEMASAILGSGPAECRSHFLRTSSRWRAE